MAAGEEKNYRRNKKIVVDLKHFFTISTLVNQILKL